MTDIQILNKPNTWYVFAAQISACKERIMKPKLQETTCVYKFKCSTDTHMKYRHK